METDSASLEPGTQLPPATQKGPERGRAQQGTACVCYFWPQRLKMPQSKMSKARVGEISGTALCKTRVLGPNRPVMTDGHPGPGHRLQEAVSSSRASAGTDDAPRLLPPPPQVMTIRPSRQGLADSAGQGGPRAGRALLQTTLLHLERPGRPGASRNGDLSGAPLLAPQIIRLGSSEEAS